MDPAPLPVVERPAEFRVVRVTDRFDDARRFYSEVLGWTVAREWSDGGRGCLFAFGSNARLEFLEGTPDVVSGLFLAAEVTDLADVIDRLRHAGVPLAQEPTVQPWGHRNLALVDPTGVKVVLFEVLPTTG